MTDNGDIDPLELEYDVVNHWYDSTNSVHNYLSRVEDTDVWVCYRTWQVGRNESEYAVYGVGEFTIDPVQLDTESISQSIRDGANNNLDERDDPLYSDLIDKSDALSETIVDEWGFGTEEIIGDEIYDGLVPVHKLEAWTEAMEPYYHEVSEAFRIHDIEDDEGIGMDIAKSVLSAAVKSNTSSWKNPHAEYMGTLQFDNDAETIKQLEEQQ